MIFRFSIYFSWFSYLTWIDDTISWWTDFTGDMEGVWKWNHANDFFFFFLSGARRKDWPDTLLFWLDFRLSHAFGARSKEVINPEGHPPASWLSWIRPCPIQWPRISHSTAFITSDGDYSPPGWMLHENLLKDQIFSNSRLCSTTTARKDEKAIKKLDALPLGFETRVID